MSGPSEHSVHQSLTMLNRKNTEPKCSIDHKGEAFCNKTVQRHRSFVGRERHYGRQCTWSLDKVTVSTQE